MSEPTAPQAALQTEAFDPEAYARTAAPLLGLSLDPAWLEPIAKNLAVLAAAAELVAGFPLADEAEAAPVFEA